MTVVCQLALAAPKAAAFGARVGAGAVGMLCTYLTVLCCLGHGVSRTSSAIGVGGWVRIQFRIRRWLSSLLSHDSFRLCDADKRLTGVIRREGWSFPLPRLSIKRPECTYQKTCLLWKVVVCKFRKVETFIVGRSKFGLALFPNFVTCALGPRREALTNSLENESTRSSTFPCASRSTRRTVFQVFP